VVFDVFVTFITVVPTWVLLGHMNARKKQTISQTLPIGSSSFSKPPALYRQDILHANLTYEYVVAFKVIFSFCSFFHVGLCEVLTKSLNCNEQQSERSQFGELTFIACMEAVQHAVLLIIWD